ncbi:hypothetical protein ABIA23_001714 [Sinorhizobium fredii]
MPRPIVILVAYALLEALVGFEDRHPALRVA